MNAPKNLKPGTRVTLRVERHPIYATSVREATYKESKKTLCVMRRANGTVHLRGMRRTGTWNTYPQFVWEGEWLRGRKTRHLVYDMIKSKPGKCDPMGSRKRRRR